MKKKKRKKIIPKEYNKIMNRIIEKNRDSENSVVDILMDLLEEASKYELIGTKRRQSRSKS